MRGRRARIALVSALVAVAAATASGCTSASGGEILTFDAAAAGPVEARAGEPFSFQNGRGFRIVLTRAVLHIGAIYLNEFLPVSGAQSTSCVSPGRYVAQVTAARDVDLLSGAPQIFPLQGIGTTATALSGEIWLMGGGDVNDVANTPPILDAAGTAEKDGTVFPFEALLTIGEQRLRPPPSPAQPGANPICRERIVSPIPIRIVPRRGGSLLVRVDPRSLFRTVDFAELPQVSKDTPLRRFDDAGADAPSVALYNALRAAASYSFVWE